MTARLHWGLVTVNALVAADEVYVPIALEVYPLKGLLKLEEIYSMVSAKLNSDIGISGVMVTIYNPTKNPLYDGRREAA